MIFTVPWRCMLIILLLAFLQSLAQQESWGLAMQAAASVVLPPWLESSQRGFGLPRHFHHTVFADGFYRPRLLQWMRDTLHRGWASWVCWIRSELPCPWQRRCSQLTSAAHSEMHRETPRLQKYQNNNLCSNHWTPIPLPPSSSVSHPRCSQKLSSGTSRLFPWHTLHRQAFRNTCSVSCYMTHGCLDSRVWWLKEK